MSTLNVANISDGTDTVETGYVVNGSAKAWVNFKGTGTAAIRDSMNVSSLQDNNTGDYTLNYTNVFASANFSVPASSMSGGTFPPAAANFNNHLMTAIPGSSQTLCYFGFYVSGGGSFYDTDQISLAAHGDLA